MTTSTTSMPAARACRLPRALGAGWRAAVALLALGGLYLGVIRPRHLRWGATDAEIARPMPLDDQIPQPTYVTNRAVTVNAPPEAIWPWLAQMGELPRGGFYSVEWVERLLGMQVRNADHIMPEFQHLQAGDHLDRAGTMIVKAVEPNRYLVLGPPEGMPFGNSVWTIALYPTGAGRTRLVSRVRARLANSPVGWFWLALLDPGQFLMEWEMLRELKQRAERSAAAGGGPATAPAAG